jgi:hypothetical protein
VWFVIAMVKVCPHNANPPEVSSYAIPQKRQDPKFLPNPYPYPMPIELPARP